MVSCNSIYPLPCDGAFSAHMYFFHTYSTLLYIYIYMSFFPFLSQHLFHILFIQLFIYFFIFCFISMFYCLFDNSQLGLLRSISFISIFHFMYIVLLFIIFIVVIIIIIFLLLLFYLLFYQSLFLFSCIQFCKQ